MISPKHRTIGVLIACIGLIGAMSLSTDAAAAKKKGKVKATAGEKAGGAAMQKAAREHYAKGKALYEEGKFDESLAEFNAAYEAKPHPTVLKSIAECQAQLGDIQGAVTTLEKYLEDPEATERESAELRIEELKKTPVKVTVTSVPDNAAVAVDGADTQKHTPTDIEMPPGEHNVTFTTDGYEPLTKPLTVTLGQEGQVGADFASEGTPVPAGPEPTLVDPFQGEDEGTPPPEVDEEKGLPAAFWAMVAVTGVGVISGTVFGTMALSMEDDYKADPTQEKKEAGQRDALVADVSFGVAAAAAIAGTVLIAVHAKKGKSGESESARLNVAPIVGPENVGMAAGITF